ncbi:hypothetical protein MBEHAL_2658 [Halarchaeum acidiphilum MH1-52-1]|uniref:Uncharacterized protein n=1 Tax=Halarchaeum acidiphilum MH1-52-1 TaxID=1261545 RepID=U3AGI1_9EURY|nr:hypothetical protein MBEHAL_2658 [Halarchaeum acidiphilum MH1-52-1]
MFESLIFDIESESLKQISPVLVREPISIPFSKCIDHGFQLVFGFDVSLNKRRLE